MQHRAVKDIVTPSNDARSLATGDHHLMRGIGRGHRKVPSEGRLVLPCVLVQCDGSRDVYVQGANDPKLRDLDARVQELQHLRGAVRGRSTHIRSGKVQTSTFLYATLRPVSWQIWATHPTAATVWGVGVAGGGCCRCDKRDADSHEGGFGNAVVGIQMITRLVTVLSYLTVNTESSRFSFELSPAQCEDCLTSAMTLQLLQLSFAQDGLDW